MKIALVSSVGGHLADLVALLPAFEDADRFWIVNDITPVLPPSERAYRITHAERDWRQFVNVAEIAAILSREQPDVIVSAGASPAVPAALIARLAGIRFVYIESSAAVQRLSMTGKLMRRLANVFFVQWAPLASRVRDARYVGGLL